MTTYSGKERMMAALKGEKTDRTAFFIDVGPHYAPRVNEKWPLATIDDFYGDIKKATEIQVKSVSDFPSDVVSIPQAYFAWQGVGENYRFKTRDAKIEDGCIKTMADVDELEAKPASEIEGFQFLKESCNRVAALAPDHGTRVAVFGPMMHGAILTGLETWIVNAVEQPEFIHKLMRVTTQSAKDRFLDMIDTTQVLILALADAPASISNISPKLYREFVFPYEMELLELMREKADESKILAIHICGFIDPIMEDLNKLPLDCIELDGPSNLKNSFEVAQGRMIIRGNVNGELFIDGTREQMEEAVKNCLDAAGGSPKYLLSSGCLVPFNAPLEKVTYFIDAALKYGTYA